MLRHSRIRATWLALFSIRYTWTKIYWIHDLMVHSIRNAKNFTQTNAISNSSLQMIARKSRGFPPTREFDIFRLVIRKIYAIHFIYCCLKLLFWILVFERNKKCNQISEFESGSHIWDVANLDAVSCSKEFWLQSENRKYKTCSRSFLKKWALN